MERSTPSEIQKTISFVRKLLPNLDDLPDKQLVQIFLQAMKELHGGPPPDNQILEMLPADFLRDIGEQLLDKGKLDESEKYFLAALEKSEKENDYYGMALASEHLGILCSNRGDFVGLKALPGLSQYPKSH